MLTLKLTTLVSVFVVLTVYTPVPCVTTNSLLRLSCLLKTRSVSQCGPQATCQLCVLSAIRLGVHCHMSTRNCYSSMFARLLSLCTCPVRCVCLPAVQVPLTMPAVFVACPHAAGRTLVMQGRAKHPIGTGMPPPRPFLGASKACSWCGSQCASLAEVGALAQCTLHFLPRVYTIFFDSHWRIVANTGC